jgi:hypothetical protein
LGSASLKLDREAEAFWICGIAMERLPSDGDKECAFIFPDDDRPDRLVQGNFTQIIFICLPL